MNLVGLALSHVNSWSVLVAGNEFALETEYSQGSMWSVGAYGLLVVRSTTVMLFGTGKDLLSDTEVSSQLILKPLCGALLVMSSA